jgi:hypothetical protein
MLAEISSGNLDAADVFFLIATILFAIAALATFKPIHRHTAETVTTIPLATMLGYAAAGFLALGFLVL